MIDKEKVKEIREAFDEFIRTFGIEEGAGILNELVNKVREEKDDD